MHMLVFMSRVWEVKLCVCVSDLLIAASFFARARLSANLFSADETDLYGEVSGLNFARCFVS